MSARGIWDVEATASEPLTPEAFQAFIEGIEKRDEEIRRLPVGPCGCPFSLVSASTMERLRTEGGGARCANCFAPFWIEPPNDRP